MRLLKSIFLILAILSLCCAAQNTASPTSQPAAGGSADAPGSTGLPAPNQPLATQTPGPGPTTPATTSAPASSSGAQTNNGNGPSAAFPAVSPNPVRAAEQPAGERPTKINDRDPLLDLPPLPKGKVSLQGGTLIAIDPVLDRIVLTPFHGKKEQIAFDVRTEFTRDGKKIAVRDLRPGTPVYADTIWDGQKVFAKSVRIFTGTHQDQEHGQILSFDAANGTLQVRDELFPEPVELKVGSNTVIRKDQSPASTADLRPGSLVAVKFQPGSRGQVDQIDVLATPGSAFVFSGPITHIDLLTHVIGISNRSDSIIYDVHFDPARIRITPELREGADVDVNTTFDGTGYSANSVTIREASSQQR